MIGIGLALSLLLAAGSGDVVVLTTGERVEGRVIEASPSEGVKVQLPDGRVRWIHPMAVERIDGADGTSRRLLAPPPEPPPVAAPPPPPAASPSPPGPEGGWPPPLAVAPEPRPEAVPAAALDAHRRGTIWLAVAAGHAKPFGRSGGKAPMLEELVGDGHTLLTVEAGLRLDARHSIGAVFDFSSANVGDELRPICAKYGRECDTATGQLGLFLRRDFDAGSPLNPWVSVGVGREWLAGEVFAPYGGGESVSVLSAPGWQLPRIGAGVDWRGNGNLGLGLYATVALGVYDRVTLDGVNVQNGPAVHGWAQLALRGILGP